MEEVNMNWKDAAHYGTAGLAMLVGGLTYMGVHIPGVEVADPLMTMNLGMAVFVAGLKGGWTSK